MGRVCLCDFQRQRGGQDAYQELTGIAKHILAQNSSSRESAETAARRAVRYFQLNDVVLARKHYYVSWSLLSEMVSSLLNDMFHLDGDQKYLGMSFYLPQKNYPNVESLAGADLLPPSIGAPL